VGEGKKKYGPMKKKKGGEGKRVPFCSEGKKRG